MAHNLAVRNGKYSIFCTEKSWHGLESEVSEISKSADVIVKAGLDYNVEKFPILADVNGNNIKVKDKWATVRTDTKDVLGVVGNRYEILQNKDAFGFIDNIVGSKEAIFDFAGALYNGEKVFISAKLPFKCTIGLDDITDFHFVLLNSHDGSKGVELFFSSTNIVCENTMKMALSNAKRKRSVRHTASVMTNMYNAAELMGITKQKVEEIQQSFEAMQKVPINDKQLRKFIEMALNPSKEQISQEEFSTRFKNTVDRVYEYSLSDSTQDISSRKGNLYGAFQGITGSCNHGIITSFKNPDDRFSSIMYGTGEKYQQNAFDLAISVIENSLVLS